MKSLPFCLSLAALAPALSSCATDADLDTAFGGGYGHLRAEYLQEGRVNLLWTPFGTPGNNAQPYQVHVEYRRGNENFARYADFVVNDRVKTQLRWSANGCNEAGHENECWYEMNAAGDASVANGPVEFRFAVRPTPAGIHEDNVNFSWTPDASDYAHFCLAAGKTDALCPGQTGGQDDVEPGTPPRTGLFPDPEQHVSMNWNDVLTVSYPSAGTNMEYRVNTYQWNGASNSWESYAYGLVGHATRGNDVDLPLANDPDGFYRVEVLSRAAGAAEWNAHADWWFQISVNPQGQY